jgi:hypothetical protein
VNHPYRGLGRERPQEPEYRYRNDATFRHVVDALEHLIVSASLTPSEVREAAMLACIHHEMRTPRPVLARLPGEEDWFRGSVGDPER